MTSRSGRVLVSGWPLLPEAEAHLKEAGLEVFVTKPTPDQAEMIRCLSEVSPDALVVRTGGVDAACFDAAPDLKMIANHGAGYDDIDVAEATRRHVPVFAAPGRNAISVAEHVFALLLAVRKQLPQHDHLIRAGQWRPAEPMTGELYGTTLGIVGFGAIGESVAKLALAFGMHVIAFDPGRQAVWPERVTKCNTIEELLKQSDSISLHVPLTFKTHNLIDADALLKMKTGAILINASRGGVVDEQALVNALDTGKLYGAGLDTFETEPPQVDTAIIQHDRVVLTPHIAGVTPESALRMSMCCAENVVDFLRTGNACRDLVNPDFLQAKRRPADKSGL